MAFRSAPLFILPLLAVAATTAHAADLIEAPPPQEFSPLTYISIEGGPVWVNSDIRSSDQDKLGNVDDGTGFYAAATLRRMFDPNWDWQITGTGTWLGETNADGGRFGDKANSDLDFQTADFDFGYHFNGNPLTRVLFGARVLHSTNSLDFDFGPDLSFLDGLTYHAEGWAVGPRVGLQSETMLGASKFGFVAEASGSVLFGSFDVDRNDDYSSGSSSESRTVTNLEGLAGLSWHATDNMTVTVGYRAQQWWGLRKDTKVVGFAPSNDYTIDVDKDVLVHGPFIRAGLTF